MSLLRDQKFSAERDNLANDGVVRLSDILERCSFIFIQYMKEYSSQSKECLAIEQSPQDQV